VTLTVTTSGRAVARSGLLPATADELLSYISARAVSLAELVRKCAGTINTECDDFAFIMIHAAYSSAEFSGKLSGKRRFLPYQLFKLPLDGPQQRLSSLMFSPSENDAMNAAILATRWVTGVPIREIEKPFQVRGGALMSMFVEAANIIRGFSDILYAVTSPQDSILLPASVDAHNIKQVSEIIGSLRRLASRLDVGLPEDVIWMATLQVDGSNLLNRAQIMAMRRAEFSSPDHILDPGRFPDLMGCFGPRTTTTTGLAQALQGAVREWRVLERNRLMESQRKRLPAECRPLLQKFYRARGVEFEDALEEVLKCLEFNVVARDDGKVPSFPDIVTDAFKLHLSAIECKSKTVGDSVTLNDATDVIRKASVNGLAHAFKITVCQPYISPDVPRHLAACSELCVVNAEDLAEAFVRYKLGKIDLHGLSDWLQRPGQALREMLPSQASIISDG